MTASELRDALAGLMQKIGGDPEVMVDNGEGALAAIGSAERAERDSIQPLTIIVLTP